MAPGRAGGFGFDPNSKGPNSPNLTGGHGNLLMFNSGMANGSGDQYDPRNNKTGAPVDYVMQPEEDENGESDKEL